VNIVATCRLTDTLLVFKLHRQEFLRRDAFQFGKEGTDDRTVLSLSAEQAEILFQSAQSD